MKKTYVISAFPATGKTNVFESMDCFTCIDSDSSNFSWIKDENGKNTKIRNPDFPKNYMEHIRNNIGKVDFIFVSSHKQVRDALKENDIEFELVYPNRELKDEYIKRFIKRGNDSSFIDFIYDNWDNFIDEMENEDIPKNKKHKLRSGEYLRHIL